MKKLILFALSFLLNVSLYAYEESYEPVVDYEAEEYVPIEDHGQYQDEAPLPRVREKNFEQFDAEENLDAFENYDEPADTYPADAYDDSAYEEGDYY